MPPKKDVPMSFRVSQEFRAALKAAAEAEHRSQANMLHVMLLAYCERRGIKLPAERARVSRGKAKK